MPDRLGFIYRSHSRFSTFGRWMHVTHSSEPQGQDQQDRIADGSGLAFHGFRFGSEIMKNPIYLPWNTSKARIKEAEEARKNRLEIVRGLSVGQISRRDLIKWGLITTAGALAPIKGLSPFVSSAYAEVPTGAPSSPGTIGLDFTQEMLRLEVLPRNPVSSLKPYPRIQSNQTKQAVDPLLGGGFGPIEGRPPGPHWVHQRFHEF